ncbi:kinase-like protein [Lophium mytilinum]|uniref:non-specific serine/threonine protein kinase n=1 Tax=Lophium mytilinum TaxID=390894 RepID=A0A6A6RCP8_9PEZI|nr:kinase-like protein [Lophium mytilinum]
MEAQVSRLTRPPPSPSRSTANGLPRLQIQDFSSPDKPDNYRISPMTLVSGETIHFSTIWDDWSGRGSHVDFGPNEKVPLEQGRFLGHGVMGGVYETHCKGVAVAWKRRYCRKKITDAEMREISILKKLSHHHIIQLVGTYTQPSTRGQFLGLLLWPVAICDLATFFEDMEEADLDYQAIGEDRSNRFRALGLPDTYKEFQPWGDKYLISKFGCLCKAIEYLHSQKIRHKDLKPSNVLLGRDNLWLTDFGSSTDFSMLSMSATENGERGTPKYFAPEVAAYEPNGRAADIFSLGCIFLEMLELLRIGTLHALKDLRTDQDGSFQANLHRAQEWFILAGDTTTMNHKRLLCEVQLMLARDPAMRPTAADLARRLDYMNQFDYDAEAGIFNLFGECCGTSYITEEKHRKITTPLQDQVASLRIEQRSTQVKLEAALKEIEHLKSKVSTPSPSNISYSNRLKSEIKSPGREITIPTTVGHCCQCSNGPFNIIKIDNGDCPFCAHSLCPECPRQFLSLSLNPKMGEGDAIISPNTDGTSVTNYSRNEVPDGFCLDPYTKDEMEYENLENRRRMEKDRQWRLERADHGRLSLIRDVMGM